MSEKVFVQYLGFEVKARVREYTFCVRELSSQPREYFVSIENEAFVSRRVRYQDAPDICTLKLQRELAANANNPPDTHCTITDADLADYRSGHVQDPVRKLQVPKIS